MNFIATPPLDLVGAFYQTNAVFATQVGPYLVVLNRLLHLCLVNGVTLYLVSRARHNPATVGMIQNVGKIKGMDFAYPTL